MQERVSGKKEELLERLFKTLESQAHPKAASSDSASLSGSKVALCSESLAASKLHLPVKLLVDWQVALASPSRCLALHNPLPVGTEMIATPTAAAVSGSTNEAPTTLLAGAVTPPIPGAVDPFVHVPKVLVPISSPSLFGSAISVAPPSRQPDSISAEATGAAQAEMRVPLSGSAPSTSGSGVAAASAQAALPKSDRAPRKPPMFSAWLQQPPEAIIKEARRLLATSPEDLRALKVHELKLLLQLKELKVTRSPCACTRFLNDCSVLRRPWCPVRGRSSLSA